MTEVTEPQVSHLKMVLWLHQALTSGARTKYCGYQKQAWANEMAQWVKALPAKPKFGFLAPRGKEKTDYCKSPSDVHTCCGTLPVPLHPNE